MLSLVPRAQWAVLELARCREGCYTADILAKLQSAVGGSHVGSGSSTGGGGGGGGAALNGGGSPSGATASEAGVNERLELVSPDGVADDTKTGGRYLCAGCDLSPGDVLLEVRTPPNEGTGPTSTH